MTTPIQTLGPADPNAPLFMKIYAVLTSVLSLIAGAQTFHLITSDQAVSLNGVGKAAVALVGAVGTAIATFRTKTQIGNGTFDKAPEPEPPAPHVTAVDAVKAVQNQFTEFTNAVAGGLAQVQSVATGKPNGEDPAVVVENFLKNQQP